MMGRKKVVSIIAALTIGALILTGCATAEPAAPAPSSAASPTIAAVETPLAAAANTPTIAPQAIPTPAPPVPAQTPTDAELMKLPWVSTYEVYKKTAPKDPGTPFLGLIASLPKGSEHLVAYRKAGGKAFALIGPRELSDKTALPVVNRQAGWVQVLIPGRRNLPSSGKPVNGPSAWVQEADVKLTKQAEEVIVDISAGTVTVYAGEKVLETHKIVMDGRDLTARGVRGFAVSIYWTEAQKACSSEKLLATSVQSDIFDSFADGVSIQAIHGWSKACRAVSLQTTQSSGCINLSDASMKRLLARIKPGTPITFND